MIDRALLDGDFVMISPSLPPKDGDIIAARLGDEATIKTLAHHDGRVVLQPANVNEHELAVSPNEDFAVVGVVCGVYRPFWEQLEQAPALTNGPTNGPSHAINGPVNPLGG